MKHTKKTDYESPVLIITEIDPKHYILTSGTDLPDPELDPYEGEFG